MKAEQKDKLHRGKYRTGVASVVIGAAMMLSLITPGIW